MRFFAYSQDGETGLAADTGEGFRGVLSSDPSYPGDLLSLLAAGSDALEAAARVLSAAPSIEASAVTPLPPISNPGKIVCVGLNYTDHTKESGYAQPTYPTLFGRFNSSLVAHNAPIIRPKLSDQLDYEGELVAVIGSTATDVSEDDALNYVAGYSIFNDGSIRDYQFLSPQWTPGKNFDGTGAFGPYFVTADALPKGCFGLQLTTRLNGEIVQSALIDDMVFSVASLVSICSKFMTLQPGDLIVTGTPSGIGFARDPKLFMKEGDVCEVEIDQIGTLVNPIRNA